MSPQRAVKDIMRRAIGANGIVTTAHVDENMRVVKGRQRPDTHEFMRADSDLCQPRLVMKMRCYTVRHGSVLDLPTSDSAFSIEKAIRLV